VIRVRLGTCPDGRSGGTAFPFDGRHQGGQIDLEGLGQERDVDQAHVALAALDAADVRSMQARALGQRLLAQGPARPEIANSSAKGREEGLSVGPYHTPTLPKEMTMRLQTMSIIRAGRYDR
jgi:hypothetical protein